MEKIEFTEEPINGDFPVVAPYKDKFYEGICVCTMLKDEFILYVSSVREISADEYLDFYNEIKKEYTLNSLDLN